MARKADLKRFHKDTISSVADKFFMERGLEKTTMDDIAKEAQYSKTTLYVYFKSKDEIFYYIVLKGMRLLNREFTQILQQNTCAIDKYISICEKIAEFNEEYPLYFHSMLETIASDSESRKQYEILEDIYQVGETLNDNINSLLEIGVKEGVFKENLPCFVVGFVHWAAISGIVSLAGKKDQYIHQRTGMSKKEFMSYGFQMLLQSIKKDGNDIE